MQIIDKYLLDKPSSLANYKSMTAKTASLDSVSSSKMVSDKSSFPKIPLIILAVVIIGLVILIVIFSLLNPKNPYKTDAFLVTINGSGVPFSALEEDTDGDKKIWVPRSKNGVLVGIRDGKNDDAKLNFAMVFGTESAIEINSKTTARTLAALHPAVENTANFYADNKNFGEIEIANTFEDRFDKVWQKENMQNALQKLLNDKSIFAKKTEEFKKHEVDNFPEKKFDYPEQILSLKNLEFDENAEWFAANFAMDQHGLVAQNFSDMKMKGIVISLKNEIKTEEDLLKNSTHFSLDAKQTMRFDGQNAWENGEYTVVLTPNVEFYTAQLYNKLLQHTTGVEYEISEQFMRDCFLNKVERKKCELPGIIDEVLQQKPAENNQLVSKFVPLFVGEEVFLNSISNLPKNTDFTKLTPAIQQWKFKGVQATLKISSAKQSYKNDEFGISFEYPGNWEIEEKVNLRWNENLKVEEKSLFVNLKKDNAKLSISFNSLAYIGFPLPRVCSNNASYTDLDNNTFRLTHYDFSGMNFDTKPKVFPEIKNTFAYVRFADIHPKEENKDTSVTWKMLDNFMGENSENYKICIRSTGTGIMGRTNLPGGVQGNQAAMGGVLLSWENDLSDKILQQADEIALSLQLQK